MTNITLAHFLLTAVLTLTAMQAHCQKVSKITFNGLKKTKESYLRSFMYSVENKDFDSIKWKEDVQLIKNTNVFFEVNDTVKISGDSVELFVYVQEAISIFPILDFSAINENFRLLVGANQINWLGKKYNLGGFYQYYDRHSFKLYQISPRHLNAKTGHEIYLTKYSTIEPLYFDSIKSDFLFDNYSISAGGFYWLNNYNRIGLGGQLMRERYTNNEIEVFDISVGEEIFMSKYQIRSFLEHKKVNLSHEFFEGLHVLISGETVQTREYPLASFYKLSAQLKYFLKIGRNGNLASNFQFGLATNNSSPFAPFVQDSYINLRGIGNRVARGTGEFVSNLEYRHTVWRNKFFFLQTNVFTDTGLLRPAGKTFKIGVEENNFNVLYGIGIRIHTRKWYNSVLRFDYGFNLINKGQGFVFGIKQFI